MRNAGSLRLRPLFGWMNAQAIILERQSSNLYIRVKSLFILSTSKPDNH